MKYKFFLPVLAITTVLIAASISEGESHNLFSNMLLERIEKLNRLENIAQLMICSMWAIGIIGIITTLCQTSKHVALRVLTAVFGISISLLTLFMEKASDSSSDMIMFKVTEAKYKIMDYEMKTKGASQITPEEYINLIKAIDSILPDNNVPKFVFSMIDNAWADDRPTIPNNISDSEKLKITGILRGFVSKNNDLYQERITTKQIETEQLKEKLKEKVEFYLPEKSDSRNIICREVIINSIDQKSI